MLDTKNPGDVVSWVADTHFKVRGARVDAPDGGVDARIREDDKAEWKKLLNWGPEDSDGQVLGFTSDGDSLWLLNSAGRDTLSLTYKNLANGVETVLASQDGVDAGAVVMHPTKHIPVAVAFNRDKVKWKVVADLVADDFRELTKNDRGELSIVSSDLDFKTWVVAYSADVKPADYYLYDRATKKLTHLFASQPELDKYKLAPMKPVTIKSRDGLELVSYLTLPVGVEPKKLPMVLMVHGGPWGRDAGATTPRRNGWPTAATRCYR